MSVKRYCWGRHGMDEYKKGKYVLATDYDSLLALARRLRARIVTTDDITLLVDSAWLEEREET